MADPQRSEKATPRRLLKAREEGNFPSTRQFLAGVHFLAFVGFLQAWGHIWLGNMQRTMAWLFRQAFAGELTLHTWMVLLWRVILYCGVPLLVAAGALMALNLGLQLALTRMGFSFKKLAPDFKRLNPASRLKMIPRHNLPSFVQAVILMPIGAYIVYVIVKGNLGLMTLPLMSVQNASLDVFHSFGTLLWRAAGVFFVFGCVDLFREQRLQRKDLRMTKQEIKDEFKETEGSPQMKMRVRRIQRDQARKRMMQQIPKATAVIVNPTHYAVALQYDPETMTAPVVIAKGKNYLALRIRQKALDHQIPLVENPPLARGLYKAVDVGQQIPPHLYKAVAEILAYIFRLMNRRGR